MGDLLRLLLVDDEPAALRRLQETLHADAGVEVVGSAATGQAAIEEARRLRPDVIILDVRLPGVDGISVASALSRPDSADVIFLSAFGEYATAAFEVEALDYLTKPLKPERLRQALDRTRRRRAERAAHKSSIGMAQDAKRAVLNIPDRNGGHNLLVSEILWIEAARDYALLHTLTRTHILRTTMAELASRLPNGFMRVHRSALVALSQVHRWGSLRRGSHCLVLADGAEVVVGPSYLAEVRDALRSLG